MAIDGEKLRKLRTAKGWSQEKLATMSSVDRRTIQRAESGAPVALETLAFIAEAIEVPPTTLRAAQLEIFEPKERKWNDIVLPPAKSGRRIIEALMGSFEAQISFDVEPVFENVKPLAELGATFETFKPDPWLNPMQKAQWGYSTFIKEQANLNMLLETLAGMGIAVFLATYTARKQIPYYSVMEGSMVVSGEDDEQEVDIAIIVVSDSAAPHLVRQPDDLWPPF
ncbi:helix-turn-helix domain-containing protein [Rhizobium sp. 768_B6_N1_8]|uniref:helix-turn-helix domain-containing protein n=1 Tax=unclassified Rhizobium TaxID=2613769 RepID=UPI003F2956B6